MNFLKNLGLFDFFHVCLFSFQNVLFFLYGSDSFFYFPCHLKYTLNVFQMFRCSIKFSYRGVNSPFIISFFFFLLYFYFIFPFLAALGLRCCTRAFSSCQERWGGATLHCGARASHCSGFSCCRAQALGTRASVVVAHRLSSCGSWAQLRHGMWDLPGPGIEPVSPALAGRFLTSVPLGKPSFYYF